MIHGNVAENHDLIVTLKAQRSRWFLAHCQGWNGTSQTIQLHFDWNDINAITLCDTLTGQYSYNNGNCPSFHVLLWFPNAFPRQLNAFQVNPTLVSGSELNYFHAIYINTEM